jgi:hypothetical protein
VCGLGLAYGYGCGVGCNGGKVRRTKYGSTVSRLWCYQAMVVVFYSNGHVVMM